MTDPVAAPRLYFDTNVFIYSIEGSADVAEPLNALFALARDNPGLAVTSELTLAEILPRASSLHRRSYLDLIIWSKIFDLQPVSRDILIETADYRKASGVNKLPDAIHAVTAIRTNCHIFLSADQRLRLPMGYSVIVPNRENLSRLIREFS